MDPTIYFASDHAGFALKNELIVFVRDVLGYAVVDCGATAYDAEDDYTEYIAKAAREVSVDEKNCRAIILGGSGQGEAMLANRFHDVRAAVYYGGSDEIIRLSRQHNNANVLSLGARFLSVQEAQEAVQLWLQTEHTTVAKYDRRIDAMDELPDTQDVPIHRISTQTPAYTYSITPSIPAQSFSELQLLLDSLRGISPEMQIDIVDGVFAPHTSWPYTEVDIPHELQKLLPYAQDFSFEFDCMCMNPATLLDVFAQFRNVRVIIHADSTDTYDTCINHAQQHGYSIGLGIKNSTHIESIAPYISNIDFIQVMGIADIGIQGQPFDFTTLQTVATLRHMYPQLEIAVDGGVNMDTITLLLKAGANRFAPGSAITKSADVVMAYKQLRESIGR